MLTIQNQIKNHFWNHITGEKLSEFHSKSININQRTKAFTFSIPKPTRFNFISFVFVFIMAPKDFKTKTMAEMGCNSILTKTKNPCFSNHFTILVMKVETRSPVLHPTISWQETVRTQKATTQITAFREERGSRLIDILTHRIHPAHFWHSTMRNKTTSSTGHLILGRKRASYAFHQKLNPGD